jgi:predicted RNA-binding Zn ribbon-like protein
VAVGVLACVEDDGFSQSGTGAIPQARRVIEELGDIDLSRLRQCQRKECDLLFFDTTRSRSQRWHAENPCGWLERQHRRRAT